MKQNSPFSDAVLDAEYFVRPSALTPFSSHSFTAASFQTVSSTVMGSSENGRMATHEETITTRWRAFLYCVRRGVGQMIVIGSPVLEGTVEDTYSSSNGLIDEIYWSNVRSPS